MKSVTSRLTAKFVVASIIASLVVAASAAMVGAHTRGESYLYLDVTDDTLTGRVELPVREIEAVLDIDVPNDEVLAAAVLEENFAFLRSYVLDHLAIGSNGDQWPIGVVDVELFDGARLSQEWGFAILSFDVEVPRPEVPRQLTVTFDPFLAEVDGHRSLLLIANSWERGFIDNEAEELVVFDRGSITKDVDLGSSSQWKNFRASIGLGVDHIKTGPDHIFFILVLLLPAVLVFRNGWEPATSFGAALWRVLKIATMFTVAHSITFTLAGMDILPLPSSKFVESVIALSIALAALHNLRPIAANKEWAIAFAFGLFHGMGFASLVSDLDISRSTQLVSLLGRNVGIELGQAFIIVVMFPGLHMMRSTRLYRWVFVAGSVVLATIASVWTVERLFDQDFGISEQVDRVIQFPRSMWLVAIFTLVAFVVNKTSGTEDEAGDDAAQEPEETELQPV